jgi:NADPH-dependent curcumin reductase CurA
VAATHARFAVGGALAAQQGGAAWPRFDTQTAMLEDLTVKGYALANGLHTLGEWPALFGRWLDEGMVYPHTIVDGGLDAAPQALIDLMGGAFTGNVVVAL